MSRVAFTWHNYTRSTLVVDGEPYRLTPKLAELAFILMARRGTFIPMPDIIEFLWAEPDDEPDYAEDVIRTYVSRLRRFLPPLTIIARACSCTDRMGPGHFLPGALMLERERALPPLGKVALPKTRRKRALVGGVK